MPRNDLIEESLVAMEAQRTTMGLLDDQVLSLIRSNLLFFEGWYSPKDIAELVALMAGVLGPIVKAAATLMDGWISDNVSLLLGRSFQPAGIRHTEFGREGITPERSLGRVADTYRYQQSVIDKAFVKAAEDGELMEDLQFPREAAIDRGHSIAQMELAVARRNQAQQTLQSAGDKIIGYRRVIHPEMDREGVCGLCVAASTRVYHVKELMALHNGCHCTPFPVTKSHDPGAAINDADLGKVYSAAGGTSRADLLNTKFRIDEHGELGPILTPVDQPIRTAEQAKRDERKPKSPQEKHKTLSRLHDRLEKSYASYEQIPVDNPEDQARQESTLHHMEQRIAQLAHDLAA